MNREIAFHPEHAAKNKCMVFLAPLLAASLNTFGQTQTANPPPSPEGEKTTSISFSASHEAGRIERAVFDNNLPMKSVWMHRTGAFATFKATRDERLGLEVTLGGTYYTATKEQADVNSKQRFFAASMPRLDASYLVGDIEQPLLRIDAGIFTYKYNENSRNLGEYLFRSGTYPGWIYNGNIGYVSTASAQLTGFRLSQSIGAFSHEIIGNLETEVLPTYDLTLSYLAKYNLGKVMTLGGGVQLARILPARPSKTNPGLIRDATRGEAAPNSSNRYFEHRGTYYADWPEFYTKQLEAATTAADSAPLVRALSVLDSARGKDRTGVPLDGGAGTPLIAVNYENFSASGIKPILYASFDPKALFGIEFDWLGPKDGILYAEAALLGVKDYPVLYENRAERIPVMVGFNVPSFGLLDVIAIEYEYYGSRYPDNYAQVMNNDAAPRPTIDISGGYDPEAWKVDDTKWSVFAQKSLVTGVALSAQVARDHSRAWQYPTGKTYWGIFSNKNHWYWMLKLTANL